MSFSVTGHRPSVRGPTSHCSQDDKSQEDCSHMCNYNEDPLNCDSHGTDAVDAAAVAKATGKFGQTSPTKLEHSMRNMKINERSAEDDDDSEYFSESTHQNNQSTSCICGQSKLVASEFEYDMSHAARGRAIIVNNVNFATETGMSIRAGSEKDADEMAEVLRMLGFSTERYSNLTCLQLIRVFQNVSAEDHSDYDCFIFAIMTHGTDGAVYCTDSVLPLDELIQELRGNCCTTLAGKPKLFFIQACRGQLLDEGVELIGHDVTDEADSGSARRGALVIPAEADFLVAYSSPPGYYSWRNISSGAWFIQALIKVLKDHGTSLEINQLLTRVNHLVAYEYMSNSNMPDFNQKKQMPYYTSTLTKELYLRHPHM